MTVDLNSPQEGVSDSEVVSAGMTVAGAGAAGIEAQFGERYLGSPNGGLYSKPWANGAGRAYKMSTLTRALGIGGVVAGMAMDAQSLQDRHITGTQFGVNIGIGLLGVFVPAYDIGLLNVSAITNFYPGGWQGYYNDFFLDQITRWS